MGTCAHLMIIYDAMGLGKGSTIQSKELRCRLTEFASLELHWAATKGAGGISATKFDSYSEGQGPK